MLFVPCNDAADLSWSEWCCNLFPIHDKLIVPFVVFNKTNGIMNQNNYGVTTLNPARLCTICTVPAPATTFNVCVLHRLWNVFPGCVTMRVLRICSIFRLWQYFLALSNFATDFVSCLFGLTRSSWCARLTFNLAWFLASGLASGRLCCLFRVLRRGFLGFSDCIWYLFVLGFFRTMQ